MDPSPAEKKELFLAGLAGLLPTPWPPVSPGWRLPGEGRRNGLLVGGEISGAKSQLKGAFTGVSPFLSGAHGGELSCIIFIFLVLYLK